MRRTRSTRPSTTARSAALPFSPTWEIASVSAAGATAARTVMMAAVGTAVSSGIATIAMAGRAGGRHGGRARDEGGGGDRSFEGDRYDREGGAGGGGERL